MDGNWVWRFPEGSGRQGRMESYCCNVICGAPTTSKVKGLRWDKMRNGQSSISTNKLWNYYFILWISRFCFWICIHLFYTHISIQYPMVCWSDTEMIEIVEKIISFIILSYSYILFEMALSTYRKNPPESDGMKFILKYPFMTKTVPLCFLDITQFGCG